MEAQLPSYSSLTVSHAMCLCSLRAVHWGGIPRPSRKRVCFVYSALSSSAAFAELTSDCLKSQNLNSTARAEFMLRAGPDRLHTQTDGPASWFYHCLCVCHCRLLCCLSSKYLLLNLAIPKIGDRSPTQNQLCPLFMTAFGQRMLIFNV